MSFSKNFYTKNSILSSSNRTMNSNNVEDYYKMHWTNNRFSNVNIIFIGNMHLSGKFVLINEEKFVNNNNCPTNERINLFNDIRFPARGRISRRAR